MAGSEVGVSGNVRPEQDGNAENSECDSGDAARGKLVGTVADALEDEEPEWGDGDKQRRKAGRDVGFRPSEDDVGGDQKQDSDDGEAEEIAARDEDLVAGDGAKAEHKQAGGGEAKASHDERGEVVNRESNGKIS